MRERVRALRAAGEPEAGNSITTAAEYGLFPSVAMGIRLGLRLPQHHIATVTTNVRTLLDVAAEVLAGAAVVVLVVLMRIPGCYSERDRR